jgi:flavin reductase (DIM6/NTAB) family NADH-FMN oxidoreductase RutF
MMNVMDCLDKADDRTEHHIHHDCFGQVKHMVTDDQFRSLMAGVCAPVTVVTTAGADGPAGTTVSAFASLSLHPPLISVAFDRGSSLLGRIQRSGRFGVNILAHGQEEIAILFARRGADRFGTVRWHLENGLPRLHAASGWAACELYNDVEAGDHRLLFGLVTQASRSDAAPLVYADQTYGTHSRLRSLRPITDQIAAFTR